MFLKLFKHDMRKLLKSCMLCYMIGIMGSTMFRVLTESSIRFGNTDESNMVIYILIALCINNYNAFMPLVSLGVVFNDKIFERQGYLIHTLPVTSRELILSKLVSGYIIVLIAVVSAIISFLILGLTVPLKDALGYLAESIPFINIGEVILLLILPMFFVINIYFCLAVGHLTKYRKTGSIALGILLMVVYAVVFSGISFGYLNTSNSNPNNLSLMLICIMTALIFVYYKAIKMIIDTKLNLI